MIFPEPSYQDGVVPSTGQRYDPDISMHMGGCPLYFNALTGRQVGEKCHPDDSFDIAVIGGQEAGLIGTSASAPEFAGLLAVFEQEIGNGTPGSGRVGNINSTASRSIPSGSRRAPADRTIRASPAITASSATRAVSWATTRSSASERRTP